MRHLINSLRDLVITFRTMTLREHLFYWLLPLSAASLFIVFYYAGPPAAQELIAPVGNREFGLLENLAHLVLLIIIGRLVRDLFVPRTKAVFAIYCLFLAWFVFVFLEEVDYGLHWIELINHVPEDKQAVVRNLHNRGGGTLDLVKALSYAGMTLLFFAVPYFLPRLKERGHWFAYFIPSRKMVFTLLTIVVVGNIAAGFDGLNLKTNDSLAGNRAEFDELATYYTFLAYFFEIGML